MTERGVEALTADREEVLKVARSLTEEEWQLPSDCEGWRIQDVIVHMADVFRAVVDPSALPPGVEGDIERSMDARVEARREWSSEKVLTEYEALSARGLEALKGLQAMDSPIPLDNLGTYPMHMIANAFAFDHFCHLRNDILKPGGPIDRPVPPSDDVRVAATLEWLIAGIPQMSADAMRNAVTKPIALHLTGPGGGEWTILPASDDKVSVVEGLAEAAAATVTSPATEFVIWATQRRPWRERDVKIEGDETYAAGVLEALHLF